MSLRRNSKFDSTCCYVFIFVATTVSVARAQVPAAEPSPRDVLSDAEWQRVDAATERALAWLVSQQRTDGSFPTLDLGQPGVTSLCVLAFLAHGHLAGEGQYGRHMQRAINYALACQKPNGWIGLRTPGGVPIIRRVTDDVGGAAVYNHAISSLMLCEVFAAGVAGQRERIQQAIQSALDVTLAEQRLPKRRAADRGGWRYLHTNYPSFITYDSDLSITSWQLKFLRAAKNAGFDVDSRAAENAVAYVRRCFRPGTGTFEYAAAPGDRRSRGMAGAGVLALALGGMHETPEAQQAGEWILRHDFEPYNGLDMFGRAGLPVDRYHYGVFHCCQAMYQLGDHYWQEFFPPTVSTLLRGQNRDGSWDPESHPTDAQFGNAYTTALVVLALGAPNQLLPVYQR